MIGPEVRVRRPPDKDALLARLTERGPFPTMRDALVFAAAVGKNQGRREPFDGSGEPIRLDLFTRDAGHDLLMSALAVLDVPDDPEVLREDRTPERVRVFEEYANGGLDVIQGELNVASRRTDADVILDLLRRAAPEPDAPDISLSRLAEVLDL